MKVLLLGASGLLGHNVLIMLLDRGYDVVVPLRQGSRLDICHERISVVRCERLDEGMLSQAAQGCGAIINSAGITDMSLLRYDGYKAINTFLPQMLVNVMLKYGIGTLVHVSTANTVGFGSVEAPASENSPMQFPFSQSFYAMSKMEGESVLLRAADEYPQLRVVIVNPGFMIGPYDIKPSSGALLLAAYRRRVMLAPKGGKSFVHVAAVATAVVNALVSGISGERYLLTAHNISISDLYKIQARVCSYKQLVVPIPNWIMYCAGFVGDVLRRLGFKISLSTRNVRLLMVAEYYSSKKAVETLQMPMISIDDAVRDFHLYRGQCPNV